MRRRRVAFDTRKQLWRRVLLLQIDSLLYLLWKNALAQPQRSIASQPYGPQTKMDRKSLWLKKTITATAECPLNHISKVLSLFSCV